MNKKVIFITQTAVMLALLIGAQFATRGFSTFVTGSLVNMILLVSTFIIGRRSGLVVALLSPLLAFLAGIGPAFIQIIPFMAAGNAILVLIASFVSRYIAKSSVKDIIFMTTGLIIAAAAKMAFLWVALVLIALPMIPGLNERQITMISAAFSWPQGVTASIGAMLAMTIVPLLKRALKNKLSDPL